MCRPPAYAPLGDEVVDVRRRLAVVAEDEPEHLAVQLYWLSLSSTGVSGAA